MIQYDPNMPEQQEDTQTQGQMNLGTIMHA
jgi:hypothetical protein